MKEIWDEFKNRFEHAETTISETDHRAIDIMKTEKQKETVWRKENRAQEIFGTPWSRSTYTLWKSQKENRVEKGRKNEEIMAETTSEIEINLKNLQIQELK